VPITGAGKKRTPTDIDQTKAPTSLMYFLSVSDASQAQLGA
jgi:hypothetical protein